MLLNQCVFIFCFVLRHRSVVQFFSNVYVCFVLRHVQFFVFSIFSNILQVLVMYINLWVYLIVFIFIGRVFILWYFVVQFFVFDNFSNVLQVFMTYLNLRVYLLVFFVFVVEVLLSFLYLLILVMFLGSVVKKQSQWLGSKNFSSLTVFGENLLADDMHSSVALDRHLQDRQHLFILKTYSGHLPAHLRPATIAVFSYYYHFSKYLNLFVGIM